MKVSREKSYIRIIFYNTINNFAMIIKRKNSFGGNDYDFHPKPALNIFKQQNSDWQECRQDIKKQGFR